MFGNKRDEASQHKERTYLVPEVQTYRLENGRLIMDEAHRVKEADSKSIPINHRSYVEPGHSEQALNDVLQAMDEHQKRYLPLMPLGGWPGSRPATPEEEARFDDFPKTFHPGGRPPKSNPNPSPKPKPNSPPHHWQDFNKHEARKYLVPDVQTYRLENGRLIMDEAHRVHDPPEMTVVPVDEYGRRKDGKRQFEERKFPLNTKNTYSPLSDAEFYRQLAQLRQHNKRENHAQLEERNSPFATLNSARPHDYFFSDRVQELLGGRRKGRHQERAQMHGTYGISDSAVENPPLRYPRLRYPKYRHNDDKSAFEERTYLIPGVRTYRLDHGRLIMDEAHRVHDPNPNSGPQNQKRSDADYGMEARGLDPSFADKREMSDGELESELAKRFVLPSWFQQPAPAPATTHGTYSPKHPNHPVSPAWSLITARIIRLPSTLGRS